MSFSAVGQSKRPSGPGSLLVALALLLVYCSSYLEILGHFVVVEHVRCAEHGRWVHADDADQEAAPEGAGAREDGPQLSRSSQEEPELSLRQAARSKPHEHEHCGASFVVRTLSPGAEYAAFIPSVSCTHGRVLESPLPAELLLSSRIFAFAPKTPPPLLG